MSASSLELPRRVAVTLAVLAALAAARGVPLPGLDREAAEGWDTSLFSALLLGPTTWVTSYLLVEVAALCRDEWRALRIGGPEGRAKLDKAVRWVWVLVCAAQGFAIAVSLEQVLGPGGEPVVPEPGPSFRALTVLTLTAGSALWGLGARAIEAHGFGKGFALLLAWQLAESVLPALQPAALFEEQHRAALAPTVFAVAATIWGTWRLGRAWTLDGNLPVLSAGLAPVAAAISLPTLPGILGMELEAWVRTAATAGIAIAGTALYATLFHLPWNVAPVIGRTEDEVAAAVRGTWTVAILAVLAVTLGSTQPWFGPSGFDALAIAYLTAHALDLHAEWRARRELGAVAVAWQLHRVYAVPAALRALEAAGIPAKVRGLRFRQLLHFFGPYVPVDVLVPAGREADAARVLGGGGAVEPALAVAAPS